MTRKMFGICMIGVVATCFIGSFVCFPVFAEGPVNISIVEKVDDGSGGLKEWQDITGAMPGMTYSAIPRVSNDGELPVSVRMCLTQSATGAGGGDITLPNNTFGIEINANWTLDATSGDSANPATGNCYNYNSELAVGGLTEPLFSEVTISSSLGNEYQNSTFNLHLVAEAIGDNPEPSPAPSPAPDSNPENAPGEPDTGANTASYMEIVSPVFITAGVIILFGIVAYFLRQRRKSHRKIH